MNKEIEEAIKRLKILECDCIYFENRKCTYNKNKCQREQDIETVLKHIKNSIPKKRIKEKIDKLKSEKENMFNRIRKLENTIGMSLEEYSELNKLYCKYNEILIKLEVLQEFLEGK